MNRNDNEVMKSLLEEKLLLELERFQREHKLSLGDSLNKILGEYFTGRLKKLEIAMLDKKRYSAGIPVARRERFFKSQSNTTFAGINLAGWREVIVNDFKFKESLQIDGVGTKIYIAELMEKYDTVGIDAVAMVVNDLACVGARPILIVDYIAQSHDDDEITGKIIIGVKRGCEIAECEFVGGERATLSDLEGHSYGPNTYHFDLACAGTGILMSEINGANIKEDNIVIGIRSNGLHSNGYTWVRPALLKEFNPNAPYRIDSKPEILGGKTIGAELLEPTQIYSKAVTTILLQDIELNGIAHITGGAFKIKLLRVLSEKRKYNIVLDNFPKPHPIFDLIQNVTGANNEGMFEAFNMGIGMCLICNPENKNEILNIIKANNCSGLEIGHLEKSDTSKVIIPKYNVEFKSII